MTDDGKRATRHEDRIEWVRETSVDLWKHYDNLRQEKNKTFLATNSILVAAVGFALKGEAADPRSNVVALLVAIVGLLTCLLWFLLLSRNALYIEFHRDRLRRSEEAESNKLPTLQEEWGKYRTMAKPWGRIPSNIVDRILATVLALFWISLVSYFGYLL